MRQAVRTRKRSIAILYAALFGFACSSDSDHGERLGDESAPDTARSLPSPDQLTRQLMFGMSKAEVLERIGPPERWKSTWSFELPETIECDSCEIFSFEIRGKWLPEGTTYYDTSCGIESVERALLEDDDATRSLHVQTTVQRWCEDPANRDAAACASLAFGIRYALVTPDGYAALRDCARSVREEASHEIEAHWLSVRSSLVLRFESDALRGWFQAQSD
jgi:hypothetical protein